MKKTSTFILGLIFSNISLAQQAHNLDSTFGTNGIVITDIAGGNEWVYSLAIQSDGKIIAAGIINSGDLVVGRFNSNGTIDNTFGTSGFQTILTNTSSSSNTDVTIQSDGKIVVAGPFRNGSNNDFGVFRLNTNGSMDNTFGSGGIQTTDIGNTNDAARALILQSDGKIIVAGQTSTGSPTSTNSVLVKYNTNGTLDNTFGTNGILIHDVSVGQEDFFIDIALQSNGKIVAAGSSNNGSNADYCAIRYNIDGTLDNTFGINGVVAVDNNNRPNNCKALTLQSDGKLILTGDHSSTTSYDYMTVRLNTDGTLDNTFANTGIVISAFASSSHNERGWDLVVQPSGKIVIAGEYRDWANVVRYNTDGSLDATFGTGGNVTLDVPGSFDKARAIVLQADGKILVGGNTFNSNNDFMLARFIGDGSITSIDETLTKNDLSVYPNPTKDRIVLDLKDAKQKITVYIQNAFGQVLDEQTYFNTKKLELKMPTDQGVYFVILLTESQTSITTRVIKTL